MRPHRALSFHASRCPPCSRSLTHEPPTLRPAYSYTCPSLSLSSPASHLLPNFTSLVLQCKLNSGNTGMTLMKMIGGDQEKTDALRRTALEEAFGKKDKQVRRWLVLRLHPSCLSTCVHQLPLPHPQHIHNYLHHSLTPTPAHTHAPPHLPLPAHHTHINIHVTPSRG